ncbi:MAG: hypothetical protein CMM99_04785 [Rickettsiales bacterium]|nr:hypothetical protein [Rickettsiales bacterium]
MNWEENMSDINVSKKILTKKKFLSQSIINSILLEVHNSMLFKNNKKKINKTNLTDLNSYYKVVKKNKSWSKIYDDFKKLKTINNILVPKILTYSKKILKKKNIKIITKGLRVIEKSSTRKYPIHQEYPGIKSKKFLVLWIALHNIKSLQGGLLIAKNVINKPLPHMLDKRKYCILKNQKFWKKRVYEKTFSSGELITLGKYVQHGTAPKKLGSPRWACIIRVGI